MIKKTVHTVWETRTYDVWGNARDGYQVNNTFAGRTVELDIPTTIYNPGTPAEFVGAFPTDSQIRKVFGADRIQLDLNGDDISIYVERARDNYPIGEMHCISHESLSPVRAIKTEVQYPDASRVPTWHPKTEGGVL